MKEHTNHTEYEAGDTILTINKEVLKMKSTITQDEARQIEIEHNVYVDRDTMMYTNADRDDVYGWMPIPAEWL